MSPSGGRSYRGVGFYHRSRSGDRSYRRGVGFYQIRGRDREIAPTVSWGEGYVAMGDLCLRQTPACEPRQKDRSQTDSLWYGRSLSESGFTGRKVIVYGTKGKRLWDERCRFTGGKVIVYGKPLKTYVQQRLKSGFLS